MYISTDDLTSGLILDADVFTDDATFLLPKGTILTQWTIMKLREFNISKVRIKKDNHTTDDFIDFNRTYLNTLSRLKSTFDTLRCNQVINISEFEGIVHELINKVNSTFNVLSYIKLIENKDEYTLQHSINVCILSMLLGKWLKYDNDCIKQLCMASILHDIGKIFIPEKILNKPSKLTTIEFYIMKQHPKLGYDLLKKSGVVDKIIKSVVLTHHERINGKGYPFGLYGKNICEESRIIAICDVYDAITSTRVYKPKEHPLKGLEIIFNNSYNGLDPYLCKVFLNNITASLNGSNALLSDGRTCKIVRIFPENPMKPWIVVDDKFVNLGESDDIKIVDIL